MLTAEQQARIRRSCVDDQAYADVVALIDAHTNTLLRETHQPDADQLAAHARFLHHGGRALRRMMRQFADITRAFGEATHDEAEAHMDHHVLATSLQVVEERLRQVSDIVQGFATLVSTVPTNEIFRPPECIAQAFELLGTRLAHTQTELHTTRGPDMPASVHGDHQRITHMLVYLLTGIARMASPGRMLVALSSAPGPPTRLLGDEPGEPLSLGMRVEVAGRAGYEQHMQRLAQVFAGQGAPPWRSVLTFDDDIASSELALGRYLLADLGGTVALRVDAELATLTLSLRLPVRSVQTETAPDPAILLAEDSPINQQVVRGFLEQQGYQVVVANNGLETLSALYEHGADGYTAILMDVEMPEMNGVDATRYIRSHFPDEQQPWIIALTGHTEAEEIARYREAGMDEWVGKSLDQFDHLLMLLNRYCQQHRAAAHAEAATEPDARAPVASTHNHNGHTQAETLTLERLRATVGGEDSLKVQELITIFLDYTSRFFTDLPRAVEQADVEGLYYAAHTLKSSSASLGAARLSELCHDLEISSKAGDMEQATRQAAEVVSELAQARAALAALRC